MIVWRTKDEGWIVIATLFERLELSVCWQIWKYEIMEIWRDIRIVWTFVLFFPSVAPLATHVDCNMVVGWCRTLNRMTFLLHWTNLSHFPSCSSIKFLKLQIHSYKIFFTFLRFLYFILFFFLHFVTSFLVLEIKTSENNIILKWNSNKNKC